MENCAKSTNGNTFANRWHRISEIGVLKVMLTLTSRFVRFLNGPFTSSIMNLLLEHAMEYSEKSNRVFKWIKIKYLEVKY